MLKVIKQLENYNKRFLHFITKLLVVNDKADIPLNISDIKNILLLRTDRIGDMAVSTPLIRALRKSVPNASIFIFASDVNAALVKGDRDISEVFIKRKNIAKTLMQVINIRRRKIDLLLNLNLNKSLANAILSHFAVPKGIKVASVNNHQYSNFYNYLIGIERNNEIHMSLLLLKFLELFDKLSVEHDSNLSISIDVHARKEAAILLRSLDLLKDQFLVFNISSIHSNRNTTDDFVIELLKGLLDNISKPILLISDPSQRNRLRFLSTSIDSNRVKISPAIELMTLTAVLSNCKLVITPDTALVHLACGVNVPVAAFYTRGERFYNEWQPIGVSHVSIFAKGMLPVRDLEPKFALEQIMKLYDEISVN